MATHLNYHPSKTKNLTYMAILTAFGILIPATMPIRFVLGPASFTLASHVPIKLAMFRSPNCAITVAISAALGFLLSGMPLVIVLRALSHLIFASIGSYYLMKHPRLLSQRRRRFMFSLVINFIHGMGEVLVVYLLTSIGLADLGAHYLLTLFVFIGCSSFIHGLMDLELAYYLARFLKERAKIPITPLDL